MKEKQPMKLNAMVLALLVITTCGCGGSLTKSNYERVETGMSLDDVEGILGKGTAQASVDSSFGGVSMNATNMVWQQDDKIITIMFMSDKVKAKSQFGF